MRFFRAPALAVVVLAATFTVAPAASAAPPHDAALALLPGRMMAALLTDDAMTLRAMCARSTTIIDEFAPYSWEGPDTCARWAAAFKAFAAKLKLTGFKGAVAANPFIDENESLAYVTGQVTFHATMAGKPVSEQGTWTFVVAKSGPTWKITSMAWGTLHHH